MPRCAECEKNGVAYDAYEGITCGRPVHVFYDDAGRLHHHRQGAITNYVCSNNHEWHEQTSTPCDVCGDEWIIGDDDDQGSSCGDRGSGVTMRD